MSDSDLILKALSEKSRMTTSEIFAAIGYEKSSRTLKRVLDQLVEKKLVKRVGVNKGTRYSLSKSYGILHSIDVDRYFEQDIDDREINESFNYELLRRDLHEVDIFTDSEIVKLESLQQAYRKNISELSPEKYQKVIERLAIDLSWKSSQIEGNTYSLLETERLLKEKKLLLEGLKTKRLCYSTIKMR